MMLIVFLVVQTLCYAHFFLLLKILLDLLDLTSLAVYVIENLSSSVIESHFAGYTILDWQS